MSIALRYLKESDVRAIVTWQHHQPDKLTAQELSGATLVPEFPEEIFVVGKNTQLYINPTTNELWYEYIDVIPTPEPVTPQRVEALEAENANLKDQQALMQAVLDDLILNGGVI